MAEVDNLANEIKNANIAGDINLLLLGETGVGKSTFINAMANYLSFKDFKAAEKDKIITLIPSSFTVVDKNYDHHRVKVGTENDDNENIKPGESATQDVKTYVFPIYEGNEQVRLIDTPGLADTRGIEQDEINCENILSYLGGLHELHGICILLKPTNTRLTVGFEYCIKKILSHLDKSAAKNIIFCFTNTRGSNFTPGETYTCIQQIIESIKKAPPHAEIPFTKNKFCFDNEAYRYLAATQNGIELDPSNKTAAIDSWRKSSEQCKKLLTYINGDKDNKPLVPHMVKTTISINETRRMINQLSKPLLDISETIEQNIRVLERHKERIKSEDQTLEELKSNLYMPVIKLKEIKLDHPATVCASATCVDVIKIEGSVNQTNYKQVCHPHCYLNNIQKEIVGDRGLVNCAAMGGTQNCKHCSCSFLSHMHIYYRTEIISDRVVDQNILRNINTKEDGLNHTRQYIEKFQIRICELREEHEKVVEAAAMFAHFLQNNAISPFNDSYAAYIDYLINREKAYGRDADPQTIQHLTWLKNRYDEIKKSFEEALKKGGENSVSSPQKIQKLINELYKLKHMGPTIKNLYQVQKTARKKEYKDSEYVHKYKPEERKKEQSKKQNKGPSKPQGVLPNKKKSSNHKQQNKNVQPPSYDQVAHNPSTFVPPRGSWGNAPFTPPPPPAGPHPSNYSNYGHGSFPTTPPTPPVYYPPRPGTEVKVTVNDRRADYSPYASGAYPHDRRHSDQYGAYPDRPYTEHRSPYPDPRPPYPDHRPPYAEHRPPYPDPRPPYPDYRPPHAEHRPPYGERYPPYPDHRPQYPEPSRPYGDSQPPYHSRQDDRYHGQRPPYQPDSYNPNRPGYTPANSAPPPDRDYTGYGGDTRNKNTTATRGQRGRGRGGGNFKRNVNRKGKGNKSSDSDDSDASSVFSYKQKKN